MGTTNTLVARYDPNGKRLTQYEAPSYICDLGYTGHLTVPSPVAGQTEMALTNFRAYDPQLAIWLSADLLGEAGGLNLDAYCYGNPLNFHDPDGLMVARPEWMLTNAEIADALSDGFFATLDGVIPFADPFADAGKSCGITRDAASAAATGGAAFARNGASRFIAGQAKSGIYQFGTRAGQYVGRAGNIGTRVLQHGSRITGKVS